MFGIFAVVLATFGFILDGTRTATGPWDSPQALGLAALACLALYLLGFPGKRDGQ